MVPFPPTRSDRLDLVTDLAPSFAALAADPRLLGLAGSVLAARAQSMKDKFIAKPPGRMGTGLTRTEPIGQAWGWISTGC